MNSQNPVFDTPIEVSSPNYPIKIEVWDEDLVLTDDFIGATYIKASDAENLTDQMRPFNLVLHSHDSWGEMFTGILDVSLRSLTFH